MLFLYSERLPIIPYGTGTGLEGGLTASKGGVCMNLQKLDQVLDYNPEDFDVKVQAGVTRHALNHYIRNEGICTNYRLKLPLKFENKNVIFLFIKVFGFPLILELMPHLEVCVPQEPVVPMPSGMVL